MDDSHVEKNQQQLERLEALLLQLSDADLLRETGDGWTVAALLAHLAFWDTRALNLLKRWMAEGVSPSPIDPDTVNDAMLPLLRAIPPRAAAQMALDAARAVNRMVESVPAELVPAIDAQGNRFLRRWMHREMHVEEMERRNK